MSLKALTPENHTHPVILVMHDLAEQTACVFLPDFLGLELKYIHPSIHSSIDPSIFQQRIGGRLNQLTARLGYILFICSSKVCNCVLLRAD